MIELETDKDFLFSFSNFSPLCPTLFVNEPFSGSSISSRQCAAKCAADNMWKTICGRQYAADNVWQLVQILMMRRELMERTTSLISNLKLSFFFKQYFLFRMWIHCLVICLFVRFLNRFIHLLFSRFKRLACYATLSLFVSCLLVTLVFSISFSLFFVCQCPSSS